jgi:hypothetical protein
MSRAPFPSVAPPFSVVRRVAFAGDAFAVGWRRSSRSFSGFVAVCCFSSARVASRFAAACRALFALPFCLVRGSGSRFCVSVPCLPPARPFRRPFSGLRAVARLCFVSVFAVACARWRERAAAPALVPPPVPVAPAVPPAVASVLSVSRSVGFSGARSASPALASLVAAVCRCVPSVSSVFVGCANGVDSVARACLPDASVFSVASGSWGSGPAAFARRSAACVAAVGAGGLWVSFPSGCCPAGLLPSRRWVSASGSGSWGSLAVAAGSGLACLVFCPGGVPAGWAFSSLGGGWWLRPADGVQLSLL